MIMCEKEKKEERVRERERLVGKAVGVREG